ncbi:hypothetical protein IEQ34_002313 [Dendrobium chrysotoxum]|uniref:Uncharacterized protein n=1 Tax=Dendrobium chrysotoxum TaxID=161865 RepID=A0AAV7HJ51_DENCH|nr:hypothetical protein IEQ34_002313 [Dendrobium chrysotoxum]
MKIKYLQGEYKQKNDHKTTKMKAVEEQLAECRAELATMGLIIEKEDVLSKAKSRSGSPKAIEDLKKSITFKNIIQDDVQEARVHLVQYKARVNIEGLIANQASDDPPSYSGNDDNDIESELQKFFSSDDEVIEIV